MICDLRLSLLGVLGVLAVYPSPESPMPPREDPVLRNARREAVVIFIAWVAATAYSCAYSYFFGYIRPGHELGPADVRPILGIPSWVVWGIIAPWLACAAFTVWFAGFVMADDDLGVDKTPELEADIREGGVHG
jgi:hypothetical protein